MGSVGKHSIRRSCKSLRPEVRKDWDKAGSSGQDRMMPCELTAVCLVAQDPHKIRPTNTLEWMKGVCEPPSPAEELWMVGSP